MLVITACIVGLLSQYAQGPTDAVLRNRSTPGRTAYTLPVDRRGVDGYIASMRCSDIGQVWRVHWQGHTARLMVFDCAGDSRTRAWMRRGNVLGEIDANVARAWGVVGKALRGAVVCEEE
jgi:putative component of toxin-antitoxin plasmid stabilization module